MVDGRVTDDVEYLSAIEEVGTVIAQADSGVDKDGNLTEEFVSVRHQGDFVRMPPEKSDAYGRFCTAGCICCCITHSIP